MTIKRLKELAHKLQRKLLPGIVVTLLLMAAFILFIHIVKIDVLDDKSWKTTIGDWKGLQQKKEYSVGDTIRVDVVVKKKVNVIGESTRYLHCEGLGNRYNIGEAKADRPVQVNLNQFFFRIPPELPREKLPTWCYIEFYNDYGWPYKIESHRTENFFLNPSLGNDVSQQPSSTPQSTIIEDSPRNFIFIPNTARETPQPNLSQSSPVAPQVIPTMPQDRKEIQVENSPQNTQSSTGLVDGVFNLLDGILNNAKEVL